MVVALSRGRYTVRGPSYGGTYLVRQRLVLCLSPSALCLYALCLALFVFALFCSPLLFCRLLQIHSLDFGKHAVLELSFVLALAHGIRSYFALAYCITLVCALSLRFALTLLVASRSLIVLTCCIHLCIVLVIFVPACNLFRNLQLPASAQIVLVLIPT